VEILRRALDDEQFAVASVQDENLLVLAPPGSGKTRVLINAAAYRLRQHAENNLRVMCLTFSTEAAREMRKRLNDSRLQAQVARSLVGNYHQLSAFLLRSHGHLLGWPRNAGLLIPPDNIRLIEQILRDLGVRFANARNVADAISNLKGRRAGTGPLPAATLQRIRERYDQELHQRHLRDFDDLIIDATRLLRITPTLRTVLHDAYPFLFIDELQDTNLLQLDLLGELIGKTTRVFAVADDDQMIYGWRDAHPANIAEFVERFEVKEKVLTGNYRCPPRIVAAANAVIVANQRRRADLMKSMVDTHQGEVLLDGAYGEDAQGQLVGRVVQQAFDEGIPAGEIAVLAPVTFLFQPVYAALDNRRIPYVKLGGRSELRAVPAVAVVGLCLIGLAGGTITDNDLNDMPRWTGEPAVDLDRIRKAVETTRVVPPRAMLPELLASLGLGSVRKPAHDPHKLQLLARMIRRAIEDSEPASTDVLARTMLLEWDRLEAAALHAEQAVKVMTSFRAKGTEYDVVVLPFLNDGLVPYQPRGSTVDWEEARRLFYVALTRARRRIVLLRDLTKPDSRLLDLVR
jgi:superfamily I DNA/RNA helicase